MLETVGRAVAALLALIAALCLCSGIYHHLRAAYLVKERGDMTAWVLPLLFHKEKFTQQGVDARNKGCAFQLGFLVLVLAATLIGVLTGAW
jgi:hypothetical protein